MCFALHRDGLFTNVDSVPRDMSPGLRKCERENEKAIRATAKFLKLVVREVTSASKHSSTKFALIQRTREKESNYTVSKMTIEARYLWQRGSAWSRNCRLANSNGRGTTKILVVLDLRRLRY